MKTALTRVLVVEDDREFRDSLTTLLKARFDSRCVGTAADAFDVLSDFTPDVCLVDLGLPDIDGEELIRKLQARDAEVPVIVLTVATSGTRILGALRAGAVGYLLKEDLDQVVVAIHDALAGGAPMSRQVARVVLSELKSSLPGPRLAKDSTVLTARETEVVDALARGLTYDNIASALSISSNTVRHHVRSIYHKLAVASKTEAVLEALRLGVIRSG
ncbi:MAG: response regulator transcription factor [Pseudomonadota bacterium]